MTTQATHAQQTGYCVICRYQIFDDESTIEREDGTAHTLCNNREKKYDRRYKAEYRRKNKDRCSRCDNNTFTMNTLGFKQCSICGYTPSIITTSDA